MSNLSKVTKLMINKVLIKNCHIIKLVEALRSEPNSMSYEDIFELIDGNIRNLKCPLEKFTQYKAFSKPAVIGRFMCAIDKFESVECVYTVDLIQSRPEF